MAPSTEDLLDHPTLGCQLRGKISKSTIQYRNLKYASIPGRWKDSVPLNTLPSGIAGSYDATRFGPSCPQKRGAQTWDLTLIGNSVLATETGQGDTERMDEFECLHINITVPQNTRPESDLPVFVWIHGGALSMGSNSWPQYDLHNFISHSTSIGKPVIGVSINYRVGILGFLAAEELGARGNYGFKDLVLGFQWVRRHIAGFGGDPWRVTAAGESAGAIAISTLLCADVGVEGLFDRVVIMSGEATLRKPRGWGWHWEMYLDQAKFLGLEGVGRAERVRRLKEWDAEEMCQRLPIAQHFCGVVDGRWLKGDVTLGVLRDGRDERHKRAWCREFVIGDTGDDGTVLKARILDNPQATRGLHTLCAHHLTPSETQSLLTAYNLPLPSRTSTAPPSKPKSSELYTSLLALTSDLRFYLPTLLVQQGWLSSTTTPPRPSSRYHFHIRNPFPGSFTGLSSHELDVAFLLQNYNDLFDEKGRKAAESVADVFIKYVNGEGWGGGKEGEVTVLTDDGVRMMGQETYDKAWRRGRGSMLLGIAGVEGGEGRLWRVAEGWQGVRAERTEEQGRKGRAKL